MRNRESESRICALLRRSGLAFGLIALAVAVLPPRSGAQVSTTTVQGTVYRADGTPASGTLLVSWPSFTTPQNQAVAAGSLSTVIGADGFVSVNLIPDAAALPGGSYYTATYHLSDGTVNQEYWVVPASGTATIAAVRAELQPSTVAVQSVSKAYVDSSLSSLSGAWLPIAGGTLTGPLTLNNDPAAPEQAATKHYADQLAAAALPLAGGTLTGALTLAGDPTAGLQAATKEYVDNGADLKQLNGALLADRWQSGNSTNDGIALSLAECATYPYACQVIAPALYSQVEDQGGLWGGGSGSTGNAIHAAGPPASAPLGCVIDNRWGPAQTICNQGLTNTATGNRFYGSSPSIDQNVTSFGPGFFAHAPSALQLTNTLLSGGRDFGSAVGIDESAMQALGVTASSHSSAGTYATELTTNCFSADDCIPLSSFSYSVGSKLANNEGGEVRLRVAESGNVWQGELRSITCGATCTMPATRTAGQPGGLGEGLPLIDIPHAYNTGYVASLTYQGVITGASTTNWDSAFGDTVAQTTTTAPVGNGSSSTNTFPQSGVTIAVANSAGFSPGQVACEFDSIDTMWQCNHVTAVPNGTSLTVDLMNYPLSSGSAISTGGLTGYGFGMDADIVDPSSTNGIALGESTPNAPVRVVYPIVSNASGNVLQVYNGCGTGACLVSRGYSNMGSGGSVAATVSGGAVTSCSATGGSGYIGWTDGQGHLSNPPQLTYSVNSGAIAPQLYIASVGSNGALSGCGVLSGGSGITSLTVTVTPQNAYHLYPQALATHVYNATTGQLDGSGIVTMPAVGVFAAGDAIEQEHYFRWKGSGINAAYAGYQMGGANNGFRLALGGLFTTNDYAAEFSNLTAATVYGSYPAGGNTPWVPGNGRLGLPYGIALHGPFLDGLSLSLPTWQGGSAVWVQCGSVCSTWNAWSNVLMHNNGQGGEDVVAYNPSSETWQWTAGAATSAGGSPVCTTTLAGTATGGLSVSCSGHTSKFDTSGNLNLAGAVKAQAGVTGATINGEITVDGVTYPTLNAAWNAAVTQAITSGQNQTLRLGPGTFPVSATMTEPTNGACVSVLGSGGATVNADSPQIATTLTVPAALNGDVFYLGNTSQAQGCTFRDLNILAGGNAAHGLELQWFRGALIDNVSVNDTTAEGILLGEENTAAGHQANFLVRNTTVSYSSAAFTPASRTAYGIHLQKTAIDSHLDDIVVRNALTAAVYNEGTGNTGYLIHGFGYPYTCANGPCSNTATSASAANASYATNYVIYDTGGAGSVWTDTYMDSPAIAGVYIGANGIAVHGGHIQWPDVTSFPAANLAYVAPAVTNNLLIADVDCLEMASGVNWITYAGASGNPPSYASVHHLTGCGNYYQSLEPANTSGFSSGGANINDPSGAVPRVWSTPVAAASSYPAYSAQMYTGYQGDVLQAHFSGVNPFFNVTYQGTIRSTGGLALGTVINTAANLTLTAANKNVIANASSGAQTLTLPSCYTALPDKAMPTGLEFTIIKSDTSANAITLQTVSSQTINYLGASAQTLAISSAGKRTLVCGPDYNWYAY